MLYHITARPFGGGRKMPSAWRPATAPECNNDNDSNNNSNDNDNDTTTNDNDNITNNVKPYKTN